jgi:hypothetical protein
MRSPFGKCPTAGLSKNRIPGLKRNIHLGRSVCPDAIRMANSKNPISHAQAFSSAFAKRKTPYDFSKIKIFWVTFFKKGSPAKGFTAG